MLSRPSYINKNRDEQRQCQTKNRQVKLNGHLRKNQCTLTELRTSSQAVLIQTDQDWSYLTHFTVKLAKSKSEYFSNDCTVN